MSFLTFMKSQVGIVDVVQQGNTVIVSIHQVILVPPSVSWNTLYLL